MSNDNNLKNSMKYTNGKVETTESLAVLEKSSRKSCKSSLTTAAVYTQYMSLCHCVDVFEQQACPA